MMSGRAAWLSLSNKEVHYNVAPGIARRACLPPNIISSHSWDIGVNGGAMGFDRDAILTPRSDMDRMQTVQLVRVMGRAALPLTVLGTKRALERKQRD